MTDSITNAWFHRLKAANRMLIKLNGGIEASVDACGYSKSEVGRWHSDTAPNLMPIDAAIRLEAECGNPVVTRAMAELNGCQLSDPREKTGDVRCVMREGSEVSRLGAEVQCSLAEAAGDMVITPNEAIRILRDLHALKLKIPDLETSLTQIIAQGGAAAGLKIVGGEG